MMPEAEQLTFDQLFFEQLTAKPVDFMYTAVSAKDAFGCCSRYRECSDAQKCLIPDVDYSINCIYRQNLEAGKILYGKNAEGFSPTKYAEYQRRIADLSSEAQGAFDELLIDFLEYNRGIRRTIIHSRYADEISSIGLFDLRPLGRSFPLEEWDNTYFDLLRNSLRENNSNIPLYTPVFTLDERVRKKERKDLKFAIERAEKGENESEVKFLSEKLKKLPGVRTKKFLRQWLSKKENLFLRDFLAGPYRIASLEPENIPYAEMIYSSTLLSSYDSRIYARSALYEDGLLTPVSAKEEEMRRIKFSRGYTAEEKETLFAEIAQDYARRRKDMVKILERLAKEYQHTVSNEGKKE